LDALHLDPEVLLVHRPQQRHQDLVGEFLVVAEVVDLVVPREPAAQEGQTARETLLQAAGAVTLPVRRGRLLSGLLGVARRRAPAGQGLDLADRRGARVRAPVPRAPAA